MILNDLTEWKNSIEDAKTRKAEIEGSIKERLKQMKKAFSVDSLDAATKRLANMNKEKEKLKKEINEEYSSLKEAIERIEEDG